MGECFAAGKRGRYEEKGGGCEVGSFFAESQENEQIKAIYGNYCFWSWLRYWWIETENQVTLMLADKSFHDYDYTEPRVRRKKTAKDTEIWSSDKVAAILGSVIDRRTGKTLDELKREADSAQDRAERIQREIRKDKRLSPD